jgi:hypothetical protein
MRRWALVVLAACAGAEEGVCADAVCLLQTQHFMQKSERLHDTTPSESSEEVWHGNDPSIQPCPGEDIEVGAEPDRCTFTGVNIMFSGSRLMDLFDDNVEMKDFYFKIGGEDPRHAYTRLERHAFPVKTTTVIVMGVDLAGNDRKCFRKVIVKDTQKPKWVEDPADLDNAITMELGPNCSISAWDAFEKYEAMGWEPRAWDNCGVDRVVTQVRQDGEVLFDSSNPFSEVPNELDESTLRGPGDYELLYTAYDIFGRRTVHSVQLTLVDLDPPTEIGGCPADMVVEVEPDAKDGDAEWKLPHVVKDNCLEYGTLPTPQEANGVGQGRGQTRRATLEVGSHTISYPLRDASGNLAEEECEFVIDIVPKAHPVTITCPADVRVDTVEFADFGVVFWAPPRGDARPGAAPRERGELPARRRAGDALSLRRHHGHRPRRWQTWRSREHDSEDRRGHARGHGSGVLSHDCDDYHGCGIHDDYDDYGGGRSNDDYDDHGGGRSLNDYDDHGGGRSHNDFLDDFHRHQSIRRWPEDHKHRAFNLQWGRLRIA